jgi:hypothetical protein
MKHLLRLGVAAWVLGAVFAACGSVPSVATNGTLGKGAAGVGGAGATSGPGSGSGSGGQDNLGGSFGSGSAGDGDAGSGGGDTCAGSTSKAELVPLDIYLMLDSSGSMSDATGQNGTGPSKWASITQALATFFTDPASAGVGLGLSHFPLRGPGVPASCTSSSQCPGASGPCLLQVCGGIASLVPCTADADCLTHGSFQCVALGQCGSEYCAPADGSHCANGPPCNPITASFCLNEVSCTASDYGTPIVEIAPLPGDSAALDSAIMAVVPEGGMPTSAALQGAVDHAAAWASQNPSHQVVVLLATDGLPDECTPDDIPGIAQIASAAAAGSPAVKTFAIGVFAQADITAGAQTNLDQIAAAGGTQQAFVVDTTQGGVGQAFLDALNAIRGTKLACTYSVPPPGNAGPLDYGKVNVEYTPPGASAPTTVGYVGTEANCDPMNGGWYYDIDPSQGTPSKIIMCSATCSAFGQVTGGEVDIRVGCKTVISPPPK